MAIVLQGRIQLHKVYDVDRLDPGARSLVPLGGEPSNGY